MIPWLMGLTSVFFRKAPKNIYQLGTLEGGSFVWRNAVLDGYKVSPAFSQQPMDLSNYLLLRTREHMLLSNKVHHTDRVLKTATSRYSAVHQKGLDAVSKELGEFLPELQKMLIVHNKQNLPVAFASNALYVLEKFGAGNTEEYAKVLLPVLKEKAEYLHNEGVAMAIWALAKAEIWDAELWSTLVAKALESDFNYTIVKNHRWSVESF